MLENEVDYVETEVMKRYSDHTLAHIHSLKKKIVYYRRACMADRDVISVMVKEIATIKEKGLFAEIEVEVMQTIDTPGIILYESSTEKSRQLVPYLIIGFLVVLCMGLIWKRI